MAGDGLTDAESSLAAAREALRRGEWQAAREQFERHVAGDPDAVEAWEGFADACCWLQDAARLFDARHQAYQGYRLRGDARSAARVAISLGSDFLEFRGEAAVGGGWLERARQLLDGLAPCIELAWLRAMDAHFALAVRSDAAETRRSAAAAREIASALGNADVEMLARALEGLALVMDGEVADGMRRLDAAAAAALGGDMADLKAISITCCFVIQACERVRDFERAAEWCTRFHELSARRRLGTFLTFCRIQYGTLLVWRGEWRAAEAELVAAREDLDAFKPAARAAALVRLGELRRRQGRWAEAAALLEEARAHRLATLRRAALALDRDDPAMAEELAVQALRRGAGTHDAERVTALELLARSRAHRGATEHAAEALAQLESLVVEIGTDPVRAAALFTAAVVAHASGREDEARDLFGDAADLFEAAGLPFEAACARLDLARACLAAGRDEAARTQASAAIELFEGLGASCRADPARTILDQTRDSRSVRGASRAGGPLTRRQREVLRLVAQGLSDREIAARLVLSEFTVHRHVANILDRLGVSSRAAAVASALRRNLV